MKCSSALRAAALLALTVDVGAIVLRSEPQAAAAAAQNKSATSWWSAPPKSAHAAVQAGAQKHRSNATATLGNKAGPPCACHPSDPSWKAPAPRGPACLFFDLGAADGETFKVFMHQSAKWTFNYDTGATPHDQCYSYLIEANPGFVPQLEPLRSPRVYPMPQVAVYMCDKEAETFHLDVSGPGGWGSALDGNHESVKATAGTMNVQVKLMNLMRLLTENALPEDTVVVKMDIEGAEWDILPCLAQSPAAKLIDTLYLENHCAGDAANAWCPTTGQAGTTWAQWEASLSMLKQTGMKIPDGYWSPML